MAVGGRATKVFLGGIDTMALPNSGMQRPALQTEDAACIAHSRT